MLMFPEKPRIFKVLSTNPWSKNTISNDANKTAVDSMKIDIDKRIIINFINLLFPIRIELK